MRKKKLLSIVLCVTLLVLSVFVPQTLATATQGRITADSVKMRKTPTTVDSETLNIFNAGAIVTILDKVTGNEAVSGGGTAWYKVQFGSDVGYVYGKYVEEISPLPFDENFEKNLLNFPESYREALRKIHNAYPNWVFKADPVNMSLDNAVDLEYNAGDMTKTKKWVELTYGIEWRDPRAIYTQEGGAHTRETRWTFASRQAIAFFMDPRNGLTLTAAKASYPNVFTFMEQSYDEKTQTAEGLKNVVKGTFLENGYGGDTNAYINDIMEAAKQSGVSPYIIAGTIITEQGKGTSNLISGTYKYKYKDKDGKDQEIDYTGYYNYFNYGAYGDNIIKNGLDYAKGAGWNSRRAAIIGGAVKYGSGYVGTGQDTYYYMDFNVFGSCNHQYASALYDQCVKAYLAKSAYVDKKDGALTFKIPVYSGFPEAVCAAPTMEDYSAQHQAVTEEPAPVTPTRRKGDYDGDGKVTVKELAVIKMHLLGVNKLSAKDCANVDVSGDGQITVKDLAIVKMYLLGLMSI